MQPVIIPFYLRSLERLPLVALDTETTSVSPAEAQVIEFSSIVLPSAKAAFNDGKGIVDPTLLKRFSGWEGNVSSLDTFIRLPEGMTVPKGASDVNGITAEMLADAPTMDIVIPELAALFDAACYGPLWITGYNIRKYDIPLLRRILALHGYIYPEPKIIDVFDLFCYHFRHKRSRKLDAACEHFDIPVPGHRARKDAAASVMILRHMREHLQITADMAGDMELIREWQRCAVWLDNEYGKWDWYL